MAPASSVIGALLLAAVSGLTGACGLAGASPTPQAVPLKVGLGYIPSVQFAQFYRAEQQGYYAAAGLDVTFQNEIDPNLITLIGQGAVDIGMADGTSIIPAAGQGIPVRYAATIYAELPNVVMTATDSGIETPADLAGRSLGIPGRFGSSWIMLQALLASVGLSVDDLQIRDYPDFGQGVALRVGAVNAATAFRNNEPVQLRLQGFETRLLTVDEATPLPGPGLTVGESTLAAKPAVLRAFVAATMRAMTEIIADPQLGLDDAFLQVPELAVDDRATQLAILEATIETWRSPYTDVNGLGAINHDAWAQSLDFMRTLPDSNIPADLAADSLVTEDLLP